MTVNERIKYIYDEARKVGITHQGAIGLLGNLKGETSDFDPMSLETMYANRFGLTDAEYTRRADAGEKVYNNYSFAKDSAGFGIAQWTWWERKQNLLDYAKSWGTSVGDLETQVYFMFREMETHYTKTWKTLTTTDDYRAAVKICVEEYEKPANMAQAIETRCGYAKEFLYVIPDAVVETGVTANSAKSAIVSAMYSELGYIEKKSNSQLYDKTANAGSGNYTKYADFIDKNYPNFYNGPKQGFAWCDVTVDAKFIEVFGYETTLKLLCTKEKSSGAGCKYSADYFRSAGQFHRDNPEIGDQIFFGPYGNEYHTGLVVYVTNESVTTIEGNTSPEYGVVDNGGMVCEKTYPLSYHSISGYGRPDYSIVKKIYVDLPATDKPVVEEKPVEKEEPATPVEKEVENEVNVTLSTLKQGDKGAQVKAMQMLIIGSGYTCGSAGADGDFGSGTLYGLKLFQKAKRLTVDGICGVNTWTKLLKG